MGCYSQANSPEEPFEPKQLEALASKELPILRQQVLLGLLKILDEVLTGAQIPYWITGGTLLGACRHEGFIPHDDDVDVECFQEDVARIQAAFKASPLPGHFIESGSWEGQRMGRLIFRDAIFIDFFLRPTPPAEEPCFPSAEELFPLERLSFHGLKLWGPQSAKAFLDRCYGPSWSREVRLWNHAEGAGEELWNQLVHRAPRVPLFQYQAAVKASGYRAPCLPSGSAQVVLEHLEREEGEAQELLWKLLGWASPFPPPAGVWGDDASDDP